jgi:hypothetical protein
MVDEAAGRGARPAPYNLTTGAISPPWSIPANDGCSRHQSGVAAHRLVLKLLDLVVSQLGCSHRLDHASEDDERVAVAADQLHGDFRILARGHRDTVRLATIVRSSTRCTRLLTDSTSKRLSAAAMESKL